MTDKPQKGHWIAIKWPEKRLPQGIGMSVKDGWNWGIGFGLAMSIAVPLVLAIIGCILMLGLSIVGSSLGALL